MPVMIGTSGWQYRHWKGGFYPHGLPTTKWLEHYADRFQTVEINNSFYRLPERATFEKWAEALPGGFQVAVKASRYLTHVRRLKDPEDPVHLLMERASGLGPKLGPVLLQLPPNLKADLEALDRTLAAFPRATKVAVEARHESWFTDGMRGLLERRNASLCLADGGPVRTPRWATSSWGYIRFHRGRARPESCYGRAALRTWAQRVGDLWDKSGEVFVYFNNDAHGCAVRDARIFAAAVANAGLEASRVPGPRDTPVS